MSLLSVAVVGFLLTFSIVPLSSTNWTYPNSNTNGNDFIHQSQLTSANGNNLTLAWAYSFPTASPPLGLNFSGEGAIAPPLIVNGIVYIIMNDLEVIAIRATDGTGIWTYQPTLNRTGLPLGILAGHVHGLTYYDGEIWASLPDCSALALNALTGRPVLRIERICADIPGNAGKYDYSGAPLVFDGESMFWTASSVSEGTDAGRGFVAAYDISSGKLLWRWYATPPAGGDPNWDAGSCPKPCHGNVPPFYQDWASLGQVAGHSRAGAGPGWGQPAVDVSDGLLFFGTSQPSPDWNATYRPGPNLYADSVVALNTSNGRMVWYYQTTPHDLYDFDCGWNVVLGTLNEKGVNVTAVFKACKNGLVYAFDAKSGDLIWYFDPPSLARLNTLNSEYTETGTYNATESWTIGPGGAVEQCPGVNGGIESDISVAYGRVYVATHNFCSFITQGPVGELGGAITGSKAIQYDAQHANTTIYAIDASTGSEVWTYYIPTVPFRGWLTSTGGMVLASTLTGRILALDAETGTLVGSTYVGAPLYEGVTLGTDGNGALKVFQLTSSPAYGGFATGTPGSLLALSPRPSTSSILGNILIFSGIAAAVAVTAVAFHLVARHRRTKSVL